MAAMVRPACREEGSPPVPARTRSPTSHRAGTTTKRRSGYHHHATMPGRNNAARSKASGNFEAIDEVSSAGGRKRTVTRDSRGFPSIVGAS